MPFSSHMSIIRGGIQISFLVFSLFMTIWVSFLRLFNILLKRKNEHLNPFKYTHKDVFKSRHDVLRVQGFKIVEYQCKTEDNAYVALWRILPNNKNDVKQEEYSSFDQSQDSQSSRSSNSIQNMGKKPVLIQHGLLDCSMSWFFHEQTLKTLPYMLANEGYDVWLGNNRGTKFTLKNSETQAYWEYSLDHLIQYDIPCLVQSVLSLTNSDKLIYIGHSQGSAQFLTALQVHPELGEKIECFFGLGPLISMKYLKSHTLMKMMDKLKVCQILRFVGFRSIFSIPVWVSKLAGYMIYNSYFFLKAILFIVTSLCGTNKENVRINLKRFGVIMSHQPGGTSVHNVQHWIQIYRKGRMHKFDYGRRKNMQIYGQPHPPQYTHDALKQMPFSFYLFRGTSDSVITDKDFQYLTNKIHPQKLIVYNLQDYAHLDYVWCQSAYEDIYMKILNVLQSNGNEDEIYDKINGSLENTNDQDPIQKLDNKI